MVHKPERWAVNAAGVAPEWQWAWRGLQSYVPLWEPGEPVNGFFDVVRQRTCSSTNPGVYGSEPTSIGMGVSVNDNTALGYSMGDHAEWSARLAGKKFATFMWVGAYNEDLNGLRGISKGTTAQSTTDWNLGTDSQNRPRFQMDDVTNLGPTNIISPNNTSVYFGLFSEGTIYVRVGYVGGQILNPSQSGNGTGSSTIQMNRATGVDATLFSFDTTTSDLNRHWNGTANAAAIWDRLLTLEEMNMLVADPFGPIRPRRLTPVDVTPIDNPVSFKEQFRGSASDPWDVAEWVEDSLGVGEVVIHSDGIGRAAGGATNANAATYSLRTFGSSLELAVDVQCTLNTVDCSLGFMVGTAWLNTSNEEADLGYGIWVPGNAAPELFKTNGASYIALGSFGVDPFTTPYYTYKIRYDSASGFLQAKQWVVGESEPGWQIGVFDTEHQGETFRVFVTEWGETGASNGVRLKNLTVSTLRDKSDSFRTKVFVP